MNFKMNFLLSENLSTYLLKKKFKFKLKEFPKSEKPNPVDKVSRHLGVDYVRG